MKFPGWIALIAFSLLIPNIGLAAGLLPWQFGMTKEQVASFKQFGPYKSFSNGDLETYNGIFRGEKHNVQFYFQDNRLVKITVLFGEGDNHDQAIATFKTVYRLLERQYGKVVIPEEHLAAGSRPNLDASAIAATANADLFRFTHINPLNQPKDMHVLGTITSGIINGKRWRDVTVSFSPL